MKEIRQCDAQVSRQRKRLSEVPQGPTTVLPANLHIRPGLPATDNETNHWNYDLRGFLPCQTRQQRLGSPFAAEWLPLQRL